MLRIDQIDDVVNLTIKHYLTDHRKAWSDISLDLVKYCSKRMIEGGRKKPSKGGRLLNFKLQHQNTGNARNTELFDSDRTKIKNLSTEAEIWWSHQVTSWSYDKREEIFQEPEFVIVDELEMREHAAMNDFWVLMEANIWGSGPSSSTEKPMPPSSIPWWLDIDTTTTPGGAFNGGAPTGFTEVAGLNPDTYPAWKNWTFGYTNVSIDDLVTKLRKAMYNCYFEAPDDFKNLNSGMPQWEHFTVYDRYVELSKLAENRNDDLGADLIRYADSVLIQGTPVKAVPYLDANTSNNPWYGVNWNTMEYRAKRGQDQVWGKPIRKDDAHQVMDVFMDHAGQVVCTDRRANFTGATSG